MAEICSARSPVRLGRMTTEFLLVMLVPSLTLGTLVLCDSDVADSLLTLPPAQSARTSDPITDAVRIGDDQVLTTHLMGHMRLWRFPQGTPLGDMQSHVAPVSCVAYSARQQLLAVGSKTGQLEIWTLDGSDHPIVTADTDLEHIYDCQFTPDGLTLMTCGENGQLIEWDSLTLTRRRTWPSEGSNEATRALAISADGKRMLAGKFGGIVQVWDLERGQKLRSHQIALPEILGDACVDSVSFISQDQEFVATTRSQGAGVWNVETGALIRPFAGIFKHVKNGTLSPDGRRFVAGTMDGELITWDTASGTMMGPVKQLQTTARCLLYSADSSTLLTGDWVGQVLFHRD